MRLVVVSAPSGAGKTTLSHLLLERQPALRFSVSHTTRAPRDGEQDHRDYHFVSRDHFAAEVERGAFLEWAEVYGNRYGTHSSEVDEARRDDTDLLVDVDLQGARAIRSAGVDATFVLIVPPSWSILGERLRGRGTDSEDVIERRLKLARAQLEGHDCYDFVVVNDDLERAYEQMAAIIEADGLRVSRQRPLLDRLLDEGSE